MKTFVKQLLVNSIKWQAFLAILLFAFLSGHGQGGNANPNNDPCDFTSITVNGLNYGFIPGGLAPNAPIPTQYFPNKQFCYGLIASSSGKPCYILGIRYDSNFKAWILRAACGVLFSKQETITLTEEKFMVFLLAHHLFNRALNTTVPCCPPGGEPQHGMASTNFSMENLLKFMKCYKALFDKYKSNPNENGNAEYLKKYLINMLKAKVANIREAVKEKQIIRIDKGTPTKTEQEWTDIADKLEGMQKTLEEKNEIEIPK